MPSVRENLTGMKVLLAEDGKDTATSYNMALEERGHQVTITNNGQDVLKFTIRNYKM
jgi:CheY-like chemotaxis protein